MDQAVHATPGTSLGRNHFCPMASLVAKPTSIPSLTIVVFPMPIQWKISGLILDLTATAPRELVIRPELFFRKSLWWAAPVVLGRQIFTQRSLRFVSSKYDQSKTHDGPPAIKDTIHGIFSSMLVQVCCTPKFKALGLVMSIVLGRSYLRYTKHRVDVLDVPFQSIVVLL